jgi:hypothetical protein
MPKHARYIPADAAIVVGINTGAISKKVAWSAITGSKMLDELKENTKNENGRQALSDIENSGIDFMSTLYLYAKPDNRFAGQMKMGLIAPIDDAAKLEAYVKKVFPAATITKVKDRSEARLNDQAYAAWTGDVLMLSNMAVAKTMASMPMPTVDSTTTTVDTSALVESDTTTTITDDLAATEPAAPTFTYEVETPDTATTAAEMDAAFTLKEEASIKDNKRFKKLEGDGHDVTLFVAYGGLMDSYTAKADMGMMSGIMNGMLWKNSAMTTGIDFEKGKIAGIMHYYPSDSMQAIAKEFGADNIDKDILSRVPEQNLNLLAGYHLSPKAVKMLLDKMNLSGMANLFLMQKGLSVDEILNAFTGDIVVALNNMGTRKPATITASADSAATSTTTTPGVDFIYAMKLNNKQSFNKIFSFITQEGGGLQQISPNVYNIPGGEGTTLAIGDKYIAISNIAANAQAFLQREGGKIPEAAGRDITGHPVGAYMDLKSIMSAGSTMGMYDDAPDSMMAQVRNMFSTATINGGEYKGEATEYHMVVNLANKDENSLLQLLQVAQHIAKANKNQGIAAK